MNTQINRDPEAEVLCYIDEELELINAKIRAKIFQTTFRLEGETLDEHYHRVYNLVLQNLKKRDAYGRIV